MYNKAVLRVPCMLCYTQCVCLLIGQVHIPITQDSRPFACLIQINAINELSNRNDAIAFSFDV